MNRSSFCHSFLPCSSSWDSTHATYRSSESSSSQIGRRSGKRENAEGGSHTSSGECRRIRGRARHWWLNWRCGFQDGNVSPKDKPSVASTVNHPPAATSPSTTISNAASINSLVVQKRTSGSTLTSTHSAAPRRGATSSSLNSGGKLKYDLKFEQRVSLE